jgi:hypothetical protein
MIVTDVPVSSDDLGSAGTGVLCPLDLHLAAIPQLLNCELPDHPVYDGLEVQTFDDAERGTGMLAFLKRRVDQKVDYYLEPGLQLDRSAYSIAGGIGEWADEHHFDAARLEVAPDGVAADIQLVDVAGRTVELRVDDRDGRVRRRSRLLAPVSAGIERPESMLLVYLRGFDLVRAGTQPPVLRIEGRDVPIGALPGARLHRRHLIKYAGPLTTVLVNRTHDGPIPQVGPASPGVELGRDGGIASLWAHQGLHNTRLELTPPLPDLRDLADGQLAQGLWGIDVDGDAITGGTWTALRHGDEVLLELAVTRRWRPADRLPPLVRIVTTVVPTFRKWPTTYRWTATVRLEPEPTMVARWERTAGDQSDT